MQELLRLTLHQPDHVLHLALPVLELASHNLEVSASEVPREHPVDMDHLFNFVDVALDKLEAHCLHEHEFHIVLLNEAVASDAVELQASIVLIDFEQELEQRDDPHLLVQMGHFLGDLREASDVLMIIVDCRLELTDLAAAKGVQEHV